MKKFKDVFGLPFEEIKQYAKEITWENARELVRKHASERQYAYEGNQKYICVIPIGNCPCAIWNSNNKWYMV